MLANRQTFEAEALTLPVSERALLAQHLLASLDETDELENEQLWLDEAQRRYNAYKNGTVSARDAFEAIAEMRGQLPAFMNCKLPDLVRIFLIKSKYHCKTLLARRNAGLSCKQIFAAG